MTNIAVKIRNSHEVTAGNCEVYIMDKICQNDRQHMVEVDSTRQSGYMISTCNEHLQDGVKELIGYCIK